MSGMRAGPMGITARPPSGYQRARARKPRPRLHERRQTLARPARPQRPALRRVTSSVATTLASGETASCSTAAALRLRGRRAYRSSVVSCAGSSAGAALAADCVSDAVEASTDVDAGAAALGRRPTGQRTPGRQRHRLRPASAPDAAAALAASCSARSAAKRARRSANVSLRAGAAAAGASASASSYVAGNGRGGVGGHNRLLGGRRHGVDHLGLHNGGHFFLRFAELAKRPTDGAPHLRQLVGSKQQKAKDQDDHKLHEPIPNTGIPPRAVEKPARRSTAHRHMSAITPANAGNCSSIPPRPPETPRNTGERQSLTPR